MTVKLKIREMRQNHPDKPTQRYMGDLLGITESNYRKLETGYTKTVSLEIMDKLCEFFKCEPGDLFIRVKTT